MATRMIPVLIYALFWGLMSIYFYGFRHTPTLVRNSGLVRAHAVLGALSLGLVLFVFGGITMLDVLVASACVVVPTLLYSRTLIFNFDQDQFKDAVEDSARKVLWDPPLWDGDAAVLAGNTLRLFFWVPLPRVAVLRYTYDRESKKVPLFQQLLAKHFNRAFPRISINS